MKTLQTARTSALVMALAVCTGYAGQRELPYVGQLYSGGSPVNQTQRFVFALYSAPTGGTLLWSSGELTQEVARGFVSVNLGSAGMTPLPEGIFDGRELFLEIQTAALGDSLTTLTPRTNLTSAAYVHNAPRLGGLPAAAYVRKWTNVIVVGMGGEAEGCDTNSLAGGIALAGGKATAANPYTVLLLPGVYDGAASTNYTDIIGVARESCVITGKLSITHSMLLENVRFDVDSHVPDAIDISAGRPTIRNVKIVTETTGVRIQPTAGAAQLINIEIQMVGPSGACVADMRGALIDGLRMLGNGIQVQNLAPMPITIDYKNIEHQGGQLALQAGIPMVMAGSVNGDVRHVKTLGSIEVNYAGALRLRDIVAEASDGAALQINGIATELKVEDARLSGPVAVRYGALGKPQPPIYGQSVFDDVEMTSISSTGPTAALEAYVPAATITVQHCELNAESGRGVHISTNDLGQATPALYIHTSMIIAAQEGINLDGATALWLYDTTVRSGMASVRGNPLAMTPAPRIADCRLQMDTNPSQGVGAPGWNAFGGIGNAGGTGEDTRGNLVAPNPGTPVAP